MLNVNELNKFLESKKLTVLGQMTGTDTLNMVNASGNAVANQFVLFLNFGDTTVKAFQSYSTIVAVECKDWIILDSKALEYSSTTTKYLKQFIKDDGTKKDIQKRIDKGFYPTLELNSK